MEIFRRQRPRFIYVTTFISLAVLSASVLTTRAQDHKGISWGPTIVADNSPKYQDAGLDARKLRPGTFGDDYPRAVELKDGSWLLVFTTYRQGDNGYLSNPKGGTVLVIMRSKDRCRNWKKISTISDPGRDMDNGEMIGLPNGDVLLATRSVRWQESYRLPVYRSADSGQTWTEISDIDSNEGISGALGNPDKGVYEPHFYQLSPGLLAVMYSTEKHVTENPSYSQSVAEKLSTDGGMTWGKEIWVASGDAADRPGMPVWTKMKNGKYIVVYEVGGPKNYPIYAKLSGDGIHWGPGLGTPVPIERGAPYLLGLSDGTLVLTSNNHRVAESDDFGTTWKPVDDAFPGGPEEAFFSSIYQVDSDHVALMTGQLRPHGGRSIAIRFGRVPPQENTSAARQTP